MGYGAAGSNAGAEIKNVKKSNSKRFAHKESTHPINKPQINKTPINKPPASLHKDVIKSIARDIANDKTRGKRKAISIEDFRNLDSLVSSEELWKRKRDMGFSMDDLCVLFLGASEYIQKAINDPTLRTVEMAEKLGWLFGFAPSALIPPHAHHECRTGGLLESVRSYQTFRIWQMELLKEMRSAYENCPQTTWVRHRVLFMREARKFFLEAVENQRRIEYRRHVRFNRTYFLPDINFTAGRVYRFKPKGPLPIGVPPSTEYFEYAFQCNGRGWLKHYVFLEPEGRTRRSFTQIQLRDFEICYVKNWCKDLLRKDGAKDVGELV